MKIEIFVMPAWIAGHPGPRDASGNIHVNLGSSPPCWNDAIGQGFMLEPTEAPWSRIFKGGIDEENEITDDW